MRVNIGSARDDLSHGKVMCKTARRNVDRDSSILGVHNGVAIHGESQQRCHQLGFEAICYTLTKWCVAAYVEPFKQRAPLYEQGDAVLELCGCCEMQRGLACMVETAPWLTRMYVVQAYLTPLRLCCQPGVSGL